MEIKCTRVNGVFGKSKEHEAHKDHGGSALSQLVQVWNFEVHSQGIKYLIGL